MKTMTEDYDNGNNDHSDFVESIRDLCIALYFRLLGEHGMSERIHLQSL